MFQTREELEKWMAAETVATSAWHHEHVLVVFRWKHPEIAFWDMSDAEGVMATGYVTLFGAEPVVATMSQPCFGSRANVMRQRLVQMSERKAAVFPTYGKSEETELN